MRRYDFSCRIEYKANHDRSLWLYAYEDGEPSWSEDRSDAKRFSPEVADALVERLGPSHRTDGRIKVHEQVPADVERRAIDKYVGRDYWNHITGE